MRFILLTMVLALCVGCSEQPKTMPGDSTPAQVTTAVPIQQEKTPQRTEPERIGDPRFPYPEQPSLDVAVHEELLKTFKRAGNAQQTLFENADAILYASDDANWRMLDIRGRTPDCQVQRALLTQKHTGEHWQNEVLMRWDLNGSACSQVWTNGQPAGRWSTWAPNGQILKLDFYKDGLKTGVSARWYPNGKKSSEWHYNDGTPSWGEAWDESGNKVIKDKPPAD